MSIKNSLLNKLARREYKRIKKKTHLKKSKWILFYNKYGFPEYQMFMMPVTPESMRRIK